MIATIAATVREHPISIGGTTLSWLGVITANAALLDAWLKRGSMIFAILASIVTIWSVIRRDRRESRAQ